jgi:hypothetical protein
MTPEEAFNEGWDYPPNIGTFGVVSPRTCGDGNCNLTKTLWWTLVQEHKDVKNLTEEQKTVLRRIQNEPESILPTE